MPKRKSSDKVSTGTPKQKKLTGFLVRNGKGDEKAKTTTEDPKDFSLRSLLKEPGWKEALGKEFDKKYMQDINSFLKKEYQKGTEIFPPRHLIFNAYEHSPLSQTKVVILGQDPYHDNGQAHGLCFSVQRGVPPPPSLKNIYKELATDIPGFKVPGHGLLEDWAKQGIFLLNATLTVEAHKANSHSKVGWQDFTDASIKVISEKCKDVVFILWGGFAQKKEKLIDSKKHTIIKAAHPSPLSVTKFLGCKCFSQTNEALKKSGKTPIDWNINN